MDKLTRTLFLASVALILGSMGCSETTRPEPPPKPPQIGFGRYWTGAEPSKKLESDEVWDVYKDSRSRYWFATDEGVSMRAGGTMTHFDQFDGIPNPLCRALGELNGRIYVGTWGGGAAVFNDTTQEWIPLPVKDGTKPGLVHNKVSAMVSDGSSLWIGTVSGMSQYFDTPGLTETQRWVNQTGKMGNSRVISRMMFQPDTSRGNEIWVATKDGGITVIRVSGSTVTSYVRYTAGTTGLPDDDVNGIAYSELDTLFWAGMATECVASVDVDQAIWSQMTTVDGLESNLVEGLATRLDKNGVEELWIGTQTGLSVVKPDAASANGIKIVNYIGGSGLPSTRIRNVVTTRDNVLWVCFIGAGVGSLSVGYLP